MVKIQLASVPKLTPFSVIVSDMYIHRIGPNENSKRITKTSINVISKAATYNIYATPNPTKSAAIMKLNVQRRVFLPKKANKNVDASVATILTTPTKAVPVVGLKLGIVAKIVLE
jgi:hypothetical protein